MPPAAALPSSFVPMALAPVDESSPDVDFLNPDSCRALCDQRRSVLKEDIEALELRRDQLIRTMKEAIVNGLCKLNKDVKKMSVKEFNDAFGCDLIGMIKTRLTEADSYEVDGATVGKCSAPVLGAKCFTSGLSLKTPAVVRFAGKPPMTRTVRKGERIVSVNGSPVDQFDKGELVVTAKKRRAVATNGTGTTPFPISIGIGAGNGECIDLSDPEQRMKLDSEQKLQAKQQLMAMQEQVKSLMANW